MIKTTIVKMTPNEITTEGYLKLKEEGQPMELRFLADPDFRGRLTSVTWNLPDNVKHELTAAETENFTELFKQVGERPEIDVSTDWIDSLELPNSALLQLRFEFETFRMEPVWYAYLYIKTPFGDAQTDSDVPYKVPKPTSSGLPRCQTCDWYNQETKECERGTCIYIDEEDDEDCGC